ncbi:unnamed protein product [Caretta caretta]
MRASLHYREINPAARSRFSRSSEDPLNQWQSTFQSTLVFHLYEKSKVNVQWECANEVSSCIYGQLGEHIKSGFYCCYYR